MEFSSTYVREIVSEVQDESFSIFLHNCGNSGQCTKAMVATGAYGYHFGNGIDMLLALDQCPKDVLVMGNIDPVSMFKMASSRVFVWCDEGFVIAYSQLSELCVVFRL